MIILRAPAREKSTASLVTTIWAIRWERASLAKSRWAGNRKVE